MGASGVVGLCVSCVREAVRQPGGGQIGQGLPGRANELKKTPKNAQDVPVAEPRALAGCPYQSKHAAYETKHAKAGSGSGT